MNVKLSAGILGQSDKAGCLSALRRMDASLSLWQPVSDYRRCLCSLCAHCTGLILTGPLPVKLDWPGGPLTRCSELPGQAGEHVTLFSLQGDAPQLQLAISSVCSLAGYVIFLISGASGAVLRCMPLMLGATLGHAVLRAAASEYKAGAAQGVDFR